MTKKIYEIDPYIKDCAANIENTKTIDGETWISLDQTIFYPQGGGQPSDFGFINDIPVLDTQIFDDKIYHKISEPIDKVRVKLSIDFERRFDHMQQHSGQHLLSAVWNKLYEINTVSFHLGTDVCTVDLETNEITAGQIKEVEKSLAEYIFENRNVESYVLPYDEVVERKLIKLKEKPSHVRFIDIEGIDSSTCCGTHVSMLGEIGMIKMISWEKYKQVTRLSFVCGKRALIYFQQVTEATHEVCNKLNVPPNKVIERFSEFYQSHQLLKKKYQKLYEKEIYHEATDLLMEAENGIVEVKWDERPLQEMKDLAKIIIETDDKVVLFCSNVNNTRIFATSSSKIFNVSNFIAALKETYGGKGGGNAVFGQWIGEVDDEGWKKVKKQLNVPFSNK